MAKYLVLLSLTSAQAISFTDNFESPALNPFWTVWSPGGLVTFPSTGQVHGGSQSVQLNVTNTFPPGFSGYAYLQHDMSQLHYGTASVWVYDPMDTGSYFGIELVSPTNAISIMAYNWDSSEYHCGTVYPRHDSGFPRTQGWHHFVLSSAVTGVTMSIDGVTVYSGPERIPFDNVHVFLMTDWPDVPIYFDDFQISAVPATQTVVSIRVSQVEMCWDTVTNNSYQVQYRSELTTNTWVNLGSPIPGDGIRKCVNDAVAGPGRFYQVVTLP